MKKALLTLLPILLLASSMCAKEDSFEPNNTKEKATVIKAATAVTGTIFPLKDHDWYKLVVPKGKRGRLVVSLDDVSKDYSPHVNIYDAEGREIGKHKRPEGTPLLTAVHTISKGHFTVFLRESNYSKGEVGYNSQFDNKFSKEPYKLLVDFKEVPDVNEPNDELKTATDVQLGKEMQGTIYPRRDKDYFSVVIPPGKKGWLSVKVTNLDRAINPHLEKFDEKGGNRRQFYRPDGEELNWVMPIEGGKYNFLLRDGCHGRGEVGYNSQFDTCFSKHPYTIQFSFAEQRDGFEPNDTLDSAKLVSLEKINEGLIYPRKDKDAFKFEVPKSARGTIKLSLSCATSLNPFIEFYGADKKRIKQLRGKNGQTCHLSHDIVKGGTFYVVIRDGNGGFSEHGYGSQMDNQMGKYAFSASFRPVAAVEESNDTIATARLLREKDEVKGTIFPRGDRDYYAIEIPKGRHQVFLKMSDVPLAICPEISVYKGKDRIYHRRGDKRFPVALGKLILEGPEKYFVQICDGNLGWGEHGYGGQVANVSSKQQYKFSWSLVDQPDVKEEQDEVGRKVSVPGEGQGAIFPVGDIDKFAFEITEEKELQFALEGYSSAISPKIELLNSDGKRIAEARVWIGKQVILKRKLVAGKYYLQVRDSSLGLQESGYGGQRDNAQSLLPYKLIIRDGAEKLQLAEFIKPLNAHATKEKSMAFDWRAKSTKRITLSDKDKLTWFNLGKCGPGELRVQLRRFDSLNTYQELEMWAYVDGQMQSLGKFKNTQGGGRGVDEAFAVDLAEQKECYLTVKQLRYWTHEPLELSVEQIAEKHVQSDNAKVGQTFLGKIWPKDDSDTFDFRLSSQGRLSVSLDHPDDLPLSTRLWKKSPKNYRILHLVGGRQDYDMFAHNPPQTEVKRLLENSTGYLAKFAPMTKPLKTTLTAKGSHINLLLTGHNIEGRLNVSIGGKKVGHKAIRRWFGWSELAYALPKEGNYDLAIEANGKDQRLVSAKLVSSTGETTVSPFRDNPLPAKFFKDYDIVVVEGLTSPGEFFLDNRSVRRSINKYVEAGGRFVCVCPQYFSYSAISKKAGGRVVSHSSGSSPDGLIEGRYQPWSGVTFSTKKLPCEILFATAGELPETLSKVVFHSCSSWNSPAEGAKDQIKDVTVSLSLENDASSFKEVGTYSLGLKDDIREFDFSPTAARFVKLTIKTNHGAKNTRLPEFEVYGPTTVNAFWGLHFQSDWIDDRIKVFDKHHPMVAKVGKSRLNGWPSADMNGWFCGAEKAGFKVVYGDKFLTGNRGITLEKAIGQGTIVFETQEVGYSANRQRAYKKVHVISGLPFLEVPNGGSDQYEVFAGGEYTVQVKPQKGHVPWYSLKGYEGKLEFTPAGSALEPNNDKYLPRDIVVGKPVEDTLHPCGDVDWFRFDVEEPSVLRISLNEVGINWDPKISLYHQGDFTKPVATINNSLKGDYGYPETQLVTVQKPGIYLLCVEDIAKNCSTQPYKLIVEPTATDRRFETNDSFVNGTKILNGESYSCALYPKGDIDTFYVEKGDGLIDIKVSEVPQDCDPALRLTEELKFPSGNLSVLYLAAGNKDECSLHKRLPQWFPVKHIAKDSVENQNVWQLIKEFDAVILDGLTSLDDFDFGKSENQKKIEDYVKQGGRFLLLSPSAMKHNHLAKKNGATIVSCTSQWDNHKWNAAHLIDGQAYPDNAYGWCSGKAPAYPQEIVFAFAKEEEKSIGSFLFYNTAQYAGRRVKEIELLSSQSAKDGFTKIGEFTISCADGPHVLTITPQKIRYLKLSIKSNYGDKGEVQFGELCAFSDDAYSSLFGVKTIKLQSNSKVVATTEAQTNRFTKGPLNGYSAYDINGWFNDWEDDGFKALYVDGNKPSRGAVTLFKRLGKGILALDAHRLGHRANGAGMWKIYNLLDVAKPITAKCDGTTGGRGSEERLQVDCAPGKYFVELLAGRHDLASLSPVKVKADYKPGEDKTSPTVVATFPPNESSSLSPKSRIFVNFSEAINEGQINKGKISISGSQSGSFSFATKYYKEDYRLELRANRPFGDHERVTIKLDAGAVRDTAGKPNEERKEWTFVTGTMARSKVAIQLKFASKAPLGSGRHKFSIHSTGSLQGAPKVLFKREGRSARNITLRSDKGNIWLGAIDIAKNTGDGKGTLIITGKDENGAKVAVSGLLNFAIDTTAPKAPAVPPVLRANKGGAVVLSWQEKTGTIVVRRGRNSSQLSEVTRVKAANQLYEDSPSGEGQYFYAISKIDDAGNESTPSKVVSIVTDVTPPKSAPAGFNAVVTNAGTIALSWQAVSEGTVGYDIHRVLKAHKRSVEPTIKVDGGALRAVDTPRDGNYTYFVAARDSAGNVGPFAKADVVLDRQAAYAYLKLLSIEPVAPVTATKLIHGRCPPGKLTFSLKLNEEVVEGPKLKAIIADGKELPVEVVDKKAVLSLPTDGADGSVKIVGYAVDKVGNKGLGVHHPSIYLDSIAPTVKIKTNRQEKPWKVRLHPSEPLFGKPKLSYTVDGKTTSIKLTSTQNFGWQGVIEIGDGSKEGEAKYSFEGFDFFGRKGTKITEGATFVSDTTPPGPPTQPEVLASRGGRLQLTWKPPLDEIPAYYKIYRSANKVFPSSPTSPFRDKIYSRSLIITVKGEEPSFFKVSAVDRAGNEGKPTAVFEARADSTPPQKPEELRAKLDKRGTIQLSWKEPKGEPIAFYRVYRKEKVVGRRVEDKFFNERIDGQGLAQYKVTAVDLAGNEGPANSVSVNFDTSPPSAQLEIDPAVKAARGRVYLNEGKLRVTLKLSEEAAEMPSLQYRTRKMTDLNSLALKKVSSKQYRGELEINKGEDGPLALMFKVLDKSGNESTQFTPKLNYHIDTTKPLSLRYLNARAIKGGRVELHWPKVEGENRPVDYLVYRKAQSKPLAVLRDEYTHIDKPGNGQVSYSIVARDEAGLSSEKIDWTSCNSDSTPPPTPRNVKSSVTDKVRLTWSAVEGQRYKVYRRQEGQEPVLAADLVGLGGFEESPIADGNFTYEVIAVDDAGNESAPSRRLKASYINRVPTAQIKLIPSSPILGPVKVQLTSNCKLLKAPRLAFHDSRKNVLPVTLAKVKDMSYVGTLQLTDKFKDGKGYFSFQATSVDGLAGTAITQGREVIVDREVPKARIEYGRPSPLKPGTVDFTLFLQEKVVGTPRLFVNLPGEKSEELPMKLKDVGTYEGQMTIPEKVKEGRAYIQLVAKDVAGNSGGEITRGKYFEVDKTPPKEPSHVGAKAEKGGYVTLRWEPPIYQPTERSSTLSAYRVYRSEKSFQSTTNAKLLRTVTYGAYHRDKPPIDGNWFYGVTTVDKAGWESKATTCTVFAKGKRPLIPVIEEAITGLDYVHLKLASQEKTPRTTPTFNIYVHQIGSRRKFAGSVKGNEYRGVPPTGGEYYFYATEVDELGNESEMSAPAKISFKKVAPVASIALSPKGPVGPNGAIVKLVASRKLSQQPSLFFSPPGGGKLAVKLEGPAEDGLTYRGQLKPPKGAKGGVGHFSWRGVAKVEGKEIVGVGINQGVNCKVDCTAPTCTIYAVASLRRFNGVTVFPVGQHEVALMFSEQLRESPRLTLRLRNKTETVLNVEKVANRKYRAFFKVDETLEECDGHFLVQAFDPAGNEGTIVTRGDSIRVDTVAPRVVKQMRVALMTEGKVRVEWTPSYRKDGTLDKSADRFEVFRTTRQLDSVEGLQPYRVVDHMLGIMDSPTADGVYRYAMRAVDRGGNRGALTKWASANIDKSPPLPPVNLAARQTKDGVVELSWDAPEGEKPLYYNAYIANEPIRTIAGISAMNERIPFTRVLGTPNNDGVYYFVVTAVDKSLNESLPSNCQRVDYRSLAPIASFKINPDIWLTDKTYEVKLETTEVLATPPQVVVNSESGKRFPLTFMGKGKSWQGRLKITEALSEGTYGFIFRGKDLQGNIGKEIAAGPLFHVDRSAPLSPGELTGDVSTKVDGAIVLRWRSPKRKKESTEVPYFYRIYRSARKVKDLRSLSPIGFVKVEFKNQDHYERTDLPPSDGRWYYAVTSLDLAKNESEPSWAGPFDIASGQPRAVIKLFTKATGDKPTKRLGKGEAKLLLTSSASLAKAPKLIYKLVEGEDQTAKVEVKLQGSGKKWQGKLEFGDYDYEQDGTFTFSAVSIDGKKGNYIAEGGTFIVDTTGPVAEITIPSISKFRVNMKTNKLETPPIKEGLIDINIKTHKPLSAAPKLAYVVNGVERNISIRGFASNWRGQMDTANGHPEGEGKFIYRGVDRLGNVSEKIAPPRKWYRTDERFPQPRVIESFTTIGEKFAIDTTAPFPPTNVELEVRKLGVAVLTWDEPEGNPARYRLYRSLTPIGSVEGMRPVKEGIFARVIVDAPPCDGNWFYVVTAVDIGGNESAPSKCVNMFVDSIKPELKIKPVPEGDGFFIVLDEEEVPPELSLTLKFPGQEMKKVSLAGTSGKLKIIPNYRHTGKPAVYLPQRVEAFNGTVKVIVHSPDPEGNIVETSTTIEGQTVTPEKGGTVQSLDESVTLEIPPGLEPVIPLGPNKVKRIDGYDKLFFITYANIPKKKSKIATGTVPGRNDLDPLPPGLEVVSKPYTVNINIPPSEPLSLKPKATQANLGGLKKLTAKLRMKIPVVSSEVIEDPDYLKTRLKVMKWVPATKAKRGGWKRVPDEAIVLDPENKELIVPADSVTTYVIVSEQTPPTIKNLQPEDGASVTEMAPLISALIVDKGTGIAMGAENRIMLRLDGETIQLTEQNLSQGDPTEVRVTWQPTKELTPGPHIVTLEAEDVVGNRRVRKWRFNIDNRPPIIDELRVGKGGLVVLTAHDPGGSLDEKKIRITAAGRRIKHRYVKELHHIVARLSNVADGLHDIIARVVDGGGKKAEKSTEYLQDRSLPIIEPVKPKADGLLLKPQGQTLSLKLSSQSGIDLTSLKLFLDGKKIVKSGDKGGQSGYRFNRENGLLTFNVPFALEDGDHEIHLSVSNAKGTRNSLTVPFTSSKEPTKVKSRLDLGTPDDGLVLVNVQRQNEISAARGRQEDDPILTTYDKVTGAILMETSKRSTIHLFLSDKAGGELKATINPNDGTIKTRYDEASDGQKILSKESAKVLWVISLLLLLSMGGIFLYQRKRLRS